MTDPKVLRFPPVDPEKRIAVLEQLVDRAAKALDAEKERADAWERRTQLLTQKIQQLYEAFGIRLVTIEETLDRHAQFIQSHELALTPLGEAAFKNGETT